MGTKDIIRTTDARVRIMELDEGAATEWHHHSEVNDFFVCLSGTIRIETRNPDTVTVLQPGERDHVECPVIHRVANLHGGRSEYLLVQGVGTYDFIEDC